MRLSFNVVNKIVLVINLLCLSFHYKDDRISGEWFVLLSAYAILFSYFVDKTLLNERSTPGMFFELKPPRDDKNNFTIDINLNK